ncbi:MAG: hypothetical protein V1739_08495 [Candidatus Omnitrophota bacterium]
MRKWFKYFLIDKDKSPSASRSSTFKQNVEDMQYDHQAGLSSPEEFLETYFNSQRRYLVYDEVLRSMLRPGPALSIGSGRCINEVLLAKDGYDITCSDLEVLPKVKSLFPGLNFICYDMTQKIPSERRFNNIFALSSFYLFDKGQLKEILNNFKIGLEPNGRLIVDIGGAQDNFLTFLIDNLITWYEIYLRAFVVKVIKRDRKKIIKKHQGFRYSDKEFIDLVQSEGYKFIDVYKEDYLTELERSYFVRRLGGLCKCSNKFFSIIGRAAPYVRVFVFEKIG